jgi:hypothetical protein
VEIVKGIGMVSPSTGQISEDGKKTFDLSSQQNGKMRREPSWAASLPLPENQLAGMLGPVTPFGRFS